MYAATTATWQGLSGPGEYNLLFGGVWVCLQAVRVFVAACTTVLDCQAQSVAGACLCVSAGAVLFFVMLTLRTPEMDSVARTAHPAGDAT